MNTYDLENRVAVITGGGQGIGFTVAKRVLDNGGKVSVWDIDQALLDLFRKRAGQSLESMSYPHHDGAIQIYYAESLGLGEREFDLVPVDF